MHRIFFAFSFLIVFCMHPAFADERLMLDYWTPFSGGDARPMQNMVNLFNAEQNAIGVSMQLIEWEHYYPALEKAILEGTPPDIAVAHVSRIDALNKVASFESLTLPANAVQLEWQDFQENLLDKVRIQEEYVAVPLDTHALAMFFNREHLNKLKLLNGQNLPSITPGPEGFLNFLRAIRDRSKGAYIPFSSPSNNMYVFWIWYALYSQINEGGIYLDQGKAAFNNIAGIRALELMLTMQDEKLWLSDIHDRQGYNLFKYGRSSVFFGGIWATWFFEQNVALQFGVSSLPVIYDRPATWGDSHALVFPGRGASERKLAALKFAKWISEHFELWFEAGHVPSHKKALTSTLLKNTKHRAHYADTLRHINAYPRHARLWEANTMFADILILALKGEMGTQEALALAEKRINATLSE